MSEAQANYGSYPAGQDARQLGALRDRLIPARPPSLEERYEHLCRGCDRLMKLRARLSVLSDRISIEPEAQEKGCATPQPSDLSGKFGDAIQTVHNNLDEIERLANRIDNALFSNVNCAQPVKNSG
jgi:hypothetical protein